MDTADTFHPVAWLAWLAAAALPALSTRNPFYLSLILLVAAVVYAALGRRSPLAQSWGAFVRFGALLWLLSIPFTALTSHHGTLVLFTLPQSWPVIGGIITLEALLYGLSGGLALVALLLIFAVFNVAVDQARLLRMTPGFIYGAGVVAGIAVAFVPQMVASWQAIREAQQVRGHKVRGVRDVLPLVMPLLVTALERAMQLAESMEARGFGGQVVTATSRQRTLNQLALLVGLGGLGAGFAGTGFWPDQRVAGRSAPRGRRRPPAVELLGSRPAGAAQPVSSLGLGVGRPDCAGRQPGGVAGLGRGLAAATGVAVLLSLPALFAVAGVPTGAGCGAHVVGDAGIVVAS